MFFSLACLPRFLRVNARLRGRTVRSTQPEDGACTNLASGTYTLDDTVVRVQASGTSHRQFVLAAFDRSDIGPMDTEEMC